MSNAVGYFVGNLTRDVELRSTKSGASVANLTVAVNEEYQSGGETKKSTSYVNFEAWGFLADDVAELKKGQKVIALGSPRTITKEEGAKSELVFKLTTIGVCPRKGVAAASASAPKAAPKTTKKTTKTVEVSADEAQDEIPF